MKYIYISILLGIATLAWAGGEADVEVLDDDEVVSYERIQASDDSAVRPIDDATPDINEIIDRLEYNQLYEGLEGRGTIIVNDRFGTRTTEYLMRMKGNSYSLMEFISTAEKGQKILRINNKIYLYFPDAEQIVTLNQSMFQQSIFDSDISYEDMAGDRSFRELYEFSLEGIETKLGQETYRIYLSAYNERETTYPYQRIWVQRDTFTLLASELFTRKKTLRKVSTIDSIQEVSAGRFLLKEATFKDVLKSDSSTKIIFEDISLREFDKAEFSIDALKF